MSSTSFPALAASPSDSSEPGCAPSPSVKSTPTAERSSQSGGQVSLFTETSATSQPKLWPTPHGMCVPNKRRAGPSGNELGRAVNQSMSSAEDSPARTSASRERVLVLQARGVDSGANTTDSFASFDPATSSWRTSQRCLVEGWSRYSETWPRSGMTRSGTAYRLPPLVPLTDETESGLWPTPTVGGGGQTLPQGTTPTGQTPDGRKQTVCLERYVNRVSQGLWPTPTVKGNHNRAGLSSKSGDGLATAVLYATPTARDFRHPGRSRKERTGGSQGECLPQQIGGPLNPTWVEWLMGYPAEWTACDASAIPSFRRLRKSSGGQS